MHDAGLDDTDRRILRVMQRDARISHVELSEAINLSASQCQRRLKRLEDLGVIDRYVALLDEEKAGFGVMAFVNITLDKHGENPARAFNEAIGRYPAILECWAVTGEADYVLRVVAQDLKSFSGFLMHDLLGLSMVASVKSNILLEKEKFTTALPV
ncbi:MAG: Lrp/AsnC family transcriptional regulator [Pseudomonadota bacterium]